MISNVPGRARRSTAPAPQLGYYPVSAVVADGQGLNITVQSYQDTLGIGIVADREQLQDPWPLLDGIHHALEELREAMNQSKRELINLEPRGAHTTAVGQAPGAAGQPLPACHAAA